MLTANIYSIDWLYQVKAKNWDLPMIPKINFIQEYY